MTMPIPATRSAEPAFSATDLSDYARRILTSRVYDVAAVTPLDSLPRLSAKIGQTVLLKREDLQEVFSFKIRGAYNKMASMPAEALARGVICASAGNHAQGVALAAKRLGIKATIVMPTTTPDIKVAGVRARGGIAVIHGDSFDDAYAHALMLQERDGLTFVHPYDDPDVIAGQGTIGAEILRQHPDPIEAIFVPVGGGGIAAGIAAFAKFLRPEIRIIGVEPDDAASMKAAIESGERVMLDRVGLFADGVAVRQAGAETFRICRACLDEVITVTGDEICAAIKDIFDETRSIAEPAGGLALAGLKRYAHERGLAQTTLIAVNSGANLNFDRLRYISERAEIGEHREALLAVTIPEETGSYRRFIQSLGGRAITEFNYRYSGGDHQAHVFVGVALRLGDVEKRQLVDRLAGEGYGVEDLSDNEIAKSHVRYMVGGRAAGLEKEVLYRFQFPEYPGALLKFLDRLGQEWSISLFHYRNHGAEYGRVLAGLLVPPEDHDRFISALEGLDYPFWRETNNPAFRLFLDGGSLG
jgi:threonine dehydratase